MILASKLSELEQFENRAANHQLASKRVKMRPKSNQCHCQALEKVSLGRAMLFVRYNWILRGVSFIKVCSRIPCFAKNWLFLFNFLFCRKFHGNSIFLSSGCIQRQSLRKETPLKIQFYLTDTITQPNDTFSRAWQWHWFDFGLIFTLFLANW